MLSIQEKREEYTSWIGERIHHAVLTLVCLYVFHNSMWQWIIQLAHWMRVTYTGLKVPEMDKHNISNFLFIYNLASVWEFVTHQFSNIKPANMLGSSVNPFSISCLLLFLKGKCSHPSLNCILFHEWLMRIMWRCLSHRIVKFMRSNSLLYLGLAIFKPCLSWNI